MMAILISVCEIIPYCSFGFHFLISKKLNIFSCAFWPSVCLLWKNVFLEPLPISFLLGLLFFYVYPANLPNSLMSSSSSLVVFLGFSIHSIHEIKRHLFLGRKVMTNLESILKSRDITLPTKVRLVKAMIFPVVMYGCEG